MGLTRCTVLLALKGSLFLDENTLGPFQTVHQLAIMLWRNVREILDRGRFRPCLIIFFGARGIGTNSSILMTSLKTGVFGVIQKRILHALQTVKFFGNWRMDRLFLSFAVRKKSTNFTHTLM